MRPRNPIFGARSNGRARQGELACHRVACSMSLAYGRHGTKPCRCSGPFRTARNVAAGGRVDPGGRRYRLWPGPSGILDRPLSPAFCQTAHRLGCHRDCASNTRLATMPHSCSIRMATTLRRSTEAHKLGAAADRKQESKDSHETACHLPHGLERGRSNAPQPLAPQGDGCRAIRAGARRTRRGRVVSPARSSPRASRTRL